MASQQCSNGGSPRQILTQIVHQIGDLSQALSNDAPVNTAGGVVNMNETVEEVRAVFAGHRQTHRYQSATTASASGSVNINPNEARAASVPTPDPRQLGISSPALPSGNISSPLYHVRRNFNNQRTAIANKRPSRSQRATPSRSSCSGANGPFSRDLILLTGPGDMNVPHQGTKVFLQEQGHIINAFEFMKEWSDIEVALQISEAFKDKIPNGVDFGIVHSVHTSLLTPTLASGQRLTGVVMNVFSGITNLYMSDHVSKS